MMDRQIFNLGLSVPAVSLYILVCDLAEHGVRPTREEIGRRFNLGAAETDASLEELLLFKVLHPSSREPSPAYHPNPASLWELPGNKD
ncbi:MAG: hypothetical protein LBR53_12770 [Deltaproteobacteria bacterium]|jgi:hypothetical protein|nr:hypothetical protein [Deltaproteobacteria bacterium]